MASKKDNDNTAENEIDNQDDKFSFDDMTINPEIEMLNNEVKRLIEKSSEHSLSSEDLKKLESLVRMRTILKDKPTKIYVQDFSEVYDRTILSTIKKKAPSSEKSKKKKKKATKKKKQTKEQRLAKQREYDHKKRREKADQRTEAKNKKKTTKKKKTKSS